MHGDIVVVKGGGDIASGVIQKLHRSGFRVLVLETINPTSIRRTVCFSEAVFNGMMEIEGSMSLLVKNEKEINEAWEKDYIPVIVDSKGDYSQIIKPIAFVDATISKKNSGVNMNIAPNTIAIGPGFEAGKDVHVVIESMRGHNLGKLIFEGFTEPNTGEPGAIEGFTFDRVLYSTTAGILETNHDFGDIVKKGDIIALVNGEPVIAKIDGLIRGLLRSGTYVTKGFKVGDVDPRGEKVDYHTISDKARAIGGAVLEAVMIGKRMI